MLMDEPFGAIDPITRARLQDEFLRILRGLKKTIVFVTHDIDEAIRMGDRIAILRDGALVQYDTPEAILAHPADAFVESFVGTDRALKRLALIARPAAVEPRAPFAAHAIAADASLRDALAMMFSAGVDALTVTGPGGAAHRASVTLARDRIAPLHAARRLRTNRSLTALALAPRFNRSRPHSEHLHEHIRLARRRRRGLCRRRGRTGNQSCHRHLGLDRIRAAHAGQGCRHLQEERRST